MKTHTLNFEGLDFEVTGTYYKGSPMVMYYRDGSGHPGDPSEFEIEKITLNGIDVTEFLDDTYRRKLLMRGGFSYNSVLEIIEEQIINQFYQDHNE